MKWLPHPFRRQPVAEILNEQLHEAERLHVEHLAAGELHIALAAIYGQRVERIRKQQAHGAELRAVK